jgi:adenosylcobinamide amidohydrolase
VTAALATAPAAALDGRWLVVRLPGPHAVLSWAIVNGGRRTASAVAWREVRDGELRPPVDAASFLAGELSRAGLEGAVGLLTSASLAAHAVVERAHGDVAARATATVGLGNALRVGDPPGPTARIGTINVLCQLSVPLSEAALVEALSLAAEARTLAVLEAGVLSRVSGAPATGTGTDCIVIAAPERPGGARYAGKHTALGHVVGASVHAAVARGVASWAMRVPVLAPAHASSGVSSNPRRTHGAFE